MMISGCVAYETTMFSCYTFLFTSIVLVGAQTNVGYLECKWNIYKAKCLGEFVRLQRENEGLAVFPDVTPAQTCLQLKNNVIDHFPHDLSSLKHVVTLDLSNNHVTELPNNLDAMVRLQILDVSHNRLSTLSPSTRFPASIRGLLLAGNGLSTIPAGFQIPSLFVIDLSQNRFTEIPEHFCVSNELIRIDFVDNPINNDISHYIGSLNKCRNTNRIPFCLFTSHQYIECNCPVLESLVFDKPSFLLGSSAKGDAEMQCSISGSQEEFTGRKIFDLDRLKLSKNCNITTRKAGISSRNNSNRQYPVCTLTFICATLAVFITLC